MISTESPARLKKPHIEIYLGPSESVFVHHPGSHCNGGKQTVAYGNVTVPRAYYGQDSEVIRNSQR